MKKYMQCICTDFIYRMFKKDWVKCIGFQGLKTMGEKKSSSTNGSVSLQLVWRIIVEVVCNIAKMCVQVAGESFWTVSLLNITLILLRIVVSGLRPSCSILTENNALETGRVSVLEWNGHKLSPVVRKSFSIIGQPNSVNYICIRTWNQGFFSGRQQKNLQ
jgi:predicted nucleic acid-binding Zn finger protein